jgi:hypothetical protein
VQHFRKDERRKGKMRRMKETSTKILACYLAMSIFVIGTVQKVYAGFSPSEIVAATTFDRAEDLQKIQKILESKMVSERLRQLRFTQEEIQARLGQLSDQEIHQLALNLDEVNVGGDGLGVVIAVLVIAILVVLFVYLIKRV